MTTTTDLPEHPPYPLRGRAVIFADGHGGSFVQAWEIEGAPRLTKVVARKPRASAIETRWVVDAAREFEALEAAWAYMRETPAPAGDLAAAVPA
jgi:hypothetical protein